MRLKILKSNTDLSFFCSNFAALSGNHVDVEYLEKATVRGFLKNGAIVGGYVINSSLPLRYFGWIPKEERTETCNTLMNQGKAVEITCIWMKDNTLNKFERNLVYVFCILDAIASGKKMIFGGSISGPIATKQRRVLCRLLYKGPVTIRDRVEGFLYYETNLGAILGIFKEFFKELVFDLQRPFKKIVGTKTKFGSLERK
jgi:hypothetical protein